MNSNQTGKATDSKVVGSRGITENLSHQQRKELISLMKRMLPPVPSKGLVDIRFAFWFFTNWYVVFIFGRDTRKQFKALDRGDMDRNLAVVAKMFTYIFMILFLIITILVLLYFLKSSMGIDIMPDEHLPEYIREKILGR
ncbi:MAG: hypothetical protein PHI68_06750 [Candidatus Cloacimonetes bacterium]|nr:hypothetical protein [Candidatus Cloacimonadota bacterium]